MIYYIIVLLFLGLALAFGRRAGCHYVCWMAPFMIIGRKVRNLFKWPALRIKVDADKCTDCQNCTRECPMSLDVHAMVRKGSMENDECILCGTCIDVCPQHVKHYSFSGW
jgi:polyferredoxin